MTPKRLLGGALILTALVYGVMLRDAPFIYEDSNWRGVLATRQVTHWTLPGRELTMQTYALTPDPRSAHLVNVGIHLANGALVALVGATLLDPMTGAVAASLFLLHPLSSEAVAYVTARSDLLVTLFALLGTYLLLTAIDRGGLWRMVLALTALVAAALCKEAGVIAAPLAVWTVMVWREDTLRTGVITTIGLLLTGLLIGLGMPLVQHADPAFVGLQIAETERLLALTLWPFGFSIDHDARSLAPMVVFAVIALVPIIAVALVGMLSRVRGRLVPWALGCLAIVIGPRVLITSPEFLSERWIYPALPMLALAAGALCVYSRPVVRIGRTYRRSASGHLQEA